MIVKMKFLSISGPKADIDRVCAQYLSKYEMQLENAVTELKTTENLLPFAEVNPYKELLARAEQFTALMPEDVEPDTSLSREEMEALIQRAGHDYLELKERKEQLQEKKDELKGKLGVLEPFCSLELNLNKAVHYRYMKVRFGRIGVDYYKKLVKYLFTDLPAVFLQGTRDENYLYGCYVAANADAGKVDSVFHSLHFERIAVAEDYDGTPAQAYAELQKKLNSIRAQIRETDQQIEKLIHEQAPKLLGTKLKLEELSNNFDVRRMAARRLPEDGSEEEYLLCGWMGASDVKAFVQEVKQDDKIFVVVEENDDGYFGNPPTKLKNPRFFKPFEMFVKMYGLPAHDEMDPTIFLAVSYTFIFGAMFGDVGQGLCLFVFGGLLYLTKKMNLAGIISIAGIFSTFFGFMFGSFFGFEDVLPALWLRPKEAMTTLPFIGQLNTVFVVAIAFGMALNLLMMVFQIINAAKAHDKGNFWFSTNGVAGLVFYGFLVLTIVLYMTGHKTPGNILLVIFLGVPVLLFLFKEPLTNLVEHRKEKIEEGRVMFLVEGFFELFETMLSYFSNTLSYVRVGAFAVSHAAMMEVVLMLAGAESGNPSWPVVVLGNIFVCCLEGLVVGIQVLRLEYYEMFSRFYKGNGREFKPFKNHK